MYYFVLAFHIKTPYILEFVIAMWQDANNSSKDMTTFTRQVIFNIKSLVSYVEQLLLWNRKEDENVYLIL